MVQNQWYHFGIGILVYFSGDWDVHWGYGVFTHDHLIRFVGVWWFWREEQSLADAAAGGGQLTPCMATETFKKYLGRLFRGTQ